jgi:hypothetical protein
MKKVRSDALWNELSPENREILDTWLFEKNMSYDEILLKAQSELGFKGSLGSLKRYRTRREQERVLTDLDELGKDADKVARAKARSGTFRVANMRVFNGYLFRALRAAPEELDKLRPLLSLMVQNDRNDVLREIKDEEFEIRREAMAFAREKFEYDTIEKALRALPQLRELAESRKDPQTKQAERSERLKQIKWMMFGDEGDEDENELRNTE